MRVAGFRFRRWRPRSVVALVLAGFVLVMLPLIAGLLIASHLVDRLGVESEQTINQAIATTRQTHRLVETLDTLQRSARQYHVLRDDEARASFLAAAADFWQRAEDLAEQTGSETLKTRIAQLAEAGEGIRRTVLQLGPEDGWPAQLTRDFSNLRAANTEILELRRRQVAADVETMRDRAREARRGLLFQVLIIVLLAAAMALLFTLLITRPIRRLNQGIRSLADPEAPTPPPIGGPRDLEALGERLHWAKRRLQRSEEERSHWLRQVSHELKTPLSALREGVSLLREGLLGPLTREQSEVAEILDTNSTELQSRIEDLLNYNRLRESRGTARIERVPFNALLEETLARHALSCKARGVEPVVEIPEQLNVDADRDMLRTIIDNLLSNAIKFAANGGRVGVYAAADSDGVKIEVADDGQGILASEREQLFEPFFRGRAPAGGQLPGSGLGLAISRELARSHGGELRVTDREGWNTVFELFLPERSLT